MDIFLMEYFCRMLFFVVWGVTFRPLDIATVVQHSTLNTRWLSEIQNSNVGVLVRLVLGRWKVGSVGFIGQKDQPGL